MPEDPRPLSPEEMDKIEALGLPLYRKTWIATVRDRERQRDEITSLFEEHYGILQRERDALREQLDEIMLKPLEPLLDAIAEDPELQDALATDNDNMLLRAERDELQRQLDEARKDTERLDWWLANNFWLRSPNWEGKPFGKDPTKWRVYLDTQWISSGDTPREAIDAAREAER